MKMRFTLDLILERVALLMRKKANQVSIYPVPYLCISTDAICGDFMEVFQGMWY